MASAAPTASAAPSVAYVSSTFQDEVATAKEAERGQSWKDRRSPTQGEKRFVHTKDQKKQSHQLRGLAPTHTTRGAWRFAASPKGPQIARSALSNGDVLLAAHTRC